MSQYNLMRTILGFKIILICLALGIHQEWIHIGDLPSLAKEGDTKAGDAETKKDDKKASEAAEDEKVVAPQDVVAADKENKTKQPEETRKSFLADLFTLPKLNAKKVQKEEIGKYMDMAERKERQIEERTLQLSKREEQLKLLEKSIDEKLLKIDEERKFLGTTIQQEKDLKGERVDKLVELFDKMEPKKAAPAFEKLDKDLTVALFKKLKQKQVTTILEIMNPEKSVEITEYFARVKSAKEYDILKELNESLKKEFQDCKGMPTASNTTAKSVAPATEAAKPDTSKK